MNQTSERGRPCPHERQLRNSRTRLSALLAAPLTNGRLRLAWVSLALMLATGGFSALAQGWLLNSRVGVTKKAVVPVYLGYESKPVAIFRADQIYGDYQRRGFFRIGVLPLVVLDGLNLELHDPTRLSTVLTNVSTHFAAKGESKKAVEGRDFSLTFSSEKDGRLHARTVRLENGTAWNLQGGTVERPGLAPIVFRQATLVVAGPAVGELTCETINGTVRLPLLSLLARPENPH